jgi:hypothetical protein
MHVIVLLPVETPISIATEPELIMQFCDLTCQLLWRPGTVKGIHRSAYVLTIAKADASAGTRAGKLRSTVALQAAPVNSTGLICNRVTSTGRPNEAGTPYNEAAHHTFNQKLKRSGGIRSFETLSLMLNVILYEANGNVLACSHAPYCRPTHGRISSCCVEFA